MSGDAQRWNYPALVQKMEPGSRFVRAWPLKGGISAGMTAVEVLRPDGQTNVLILRQPGEDALRQNPRAAEDEFHLLQITQELGLATPKPVVLDLSGEILPGPYLVIEYVEGQPEFPKAPPVDFAFQLAEHLARIHSAAGAGPDFSFLDRPGQTHTGIFGEGLGQAGGGLEVGQVRELVKSAWPFPQRNATALLHGDYWPGNVLWREGVLAAVIDWEDAGLGDPLNDLAISRLDLLWISGREAMESFTGRYLVMRAIDTTCLPYWDLCAALRLARLVGFDLTGWATFFRPYGRTDITETSIQEHFQFFVSQATARIEKTL